MNKLTEIRKIIISNKNLKEILSLMIENGDSNRELFIYGAGEFLSTCTFVLDHFVIPTQIAYTTAFGVGVEIEENSIREMYRYFISEKREALVQIHSHPQEAYHSSADDLSTIFCKTGQYSLVVPNYGDIDNYNDIKIYKLSSDGIWDEFPHSFGKLFEVI